MNNIKTKEDAKKEVESIIRDMISRVFNGSIPENVLSKTIEDIHSIYNDLLN